MNTEELFRTINKCIDELDFVSARMFMENNIEVVQHRKHRLHTNAQELFEFVMKRDENESLLNPKEIAIIQSINQYASTFDIRAFKLLARDQGPLLSRVDALSYLNSDAKALLSSMQGMQLQS